MRIAVEAGIQYQVEAARSMLDLSRLSSATTWTEWSSKGRFTFFKHPEFCWTCQAGRFQLVLWVFDFDTSSDRTASWSLNVAGHWTCQFFSVSAPKLHRLAQLELQFVLNTEAVWVWVWLPDASTYCLGSCFMMISLFYLAHHFRFPRCTAVWSAVPFSQAVGLKPCSETTAHLKSFRQITHSCSTSMSCDELWKQPKRHRRFPWSQWSTCVRYLDVAYWIHSYGPVPVCDIYIYKNNQYNVLTARDCNALPPHDSASHVSGEAWRSTIDQPEPWNLPSKQLHLKYPKVSLL